MADGSAIAVMSLVLVFETAFLFVMYMIGGSFLKSKLKEIMPWNKNKGAFNLHLDKTGTFIMDYKVLKGKNKIRRKNKHDILLNDNHHSFIDSTRYNKDFVSIHKMDRVPLYLTVEGSPTNVLAKYRDYDKDLYKIKSIYKYIQDVIAKEDIAKFKKANTKIINLFLNLRNAFKYLPEAKMICEETAYAFDANKEYKIEDYKKLFNFYANSFVSLSRLLKEKNHTFVNFKEFFNEGNISALFNKITREYEQLGRLSMQKKQAGMDKAVKIGGGIFLAAMGILAFLVVDQGNKIEDVSIKINQINKKLNDGITVGSDDTNQGAGESPSGSPVVSQNLQGDNHPNTSYPLRYELNNLAHTSPSL